MPLGRRSSGAGCLWVCGALGPAVKPTASHPRTSAVQQVLIKGRFADQIANLALCGPWPDITRPRHNLPAITQPQLNPAPTGPRPGPRPSTGRSAAGWAQTNQGPHRHAERHKAGLSAPPFAVPRRVFPAPFTGPSNPCRKGLTCPPAAFRIISPKTGGGYVFAQTDLGLVFL